MRVWGRFPFGGASLVVIVAILLAACGPTPIPTPSPSTSPASPSPSPSAPAAGDLALEACDVTGYVPCEHQEVRLALPIAGTGAALTYSSEWAPGRKDRPGWDASAIGLGGWSLDILQRYDPAAGVLLSGDGSWRFAKGVTLPSGEHAVPTYDGLQVFVFDSKGRHVRTVDGLLGTTLITFLYDADGRLSGADGTLDSAPIHLVVEREADGSLVGLVGLDGARTRLFLDRDGPLGGIRDPAGRTTVLANASGGLVTEYDDPTGGVTAYEYDDAGRLVSAKDPDGVTVTMARTATADMTEVKSTTTLGRSATYRAERTVAGVIRSYVAPDGTRTTVSTDPSGQHAVALPDGTTIALGSQADPRWGMDAPIATPVDQTRPDGVVQHTTTAITATTPATDPLAVSAWSRTDIVADGTWNETADPASRTITWADPAGRKTTQTYDPSGRMVSQKAPGQPSLAFAYDGRGRLATSTSGSGADAATTTYTHGTGGDLETAGPDGTVEHLAGDAFGRTVSTTAPDASTVLFAYDAFGRLARVSPAGHPSTTIGYSAAGRQTGFLPPAISSDDSFEARTYDADGNLATIAGPGDRSIAYAYDGSGRVSGWTFGDGTATAEFDPTTGLVVNNTAPGGINTQTSYVGGIPVTRNVSGPVAGTVAVSLDGWGRPAGVSVDRGAPIGYSYDAAGYLTAVGPVILARDAASGGVSSAELGVVRTTREFDAQGRLSHVVTVANGTPAILDLRYAYDLRDRVSSMTVSRTGATPTTTTYAYDGAGRLVEVTQNGSLVERDGYDPAGNRISVKTPSGTLRATYDERDRLQAWGSAKYTFRPDGQLATVSRPGATETYDFDDFGALTAVTVADERHIDYLVDAGGERVGKKVAGVLVTGYLWGPDGALAAQTDESGAVVARFGYDDAGRLVFVERGTTRYEVVTDHLGSPLLVVDAGSGAVAEAMTYDAWGNVTSDTDPGFIPIGFAGGLRDADTGLVKFGAREYDPRTGRWTGPDPIGFAGGDPLLYRYVRGDPVNGTDPSGLSGPVTHGPGDLGRSLPPKSGASDSGGQEVTIGPIEIDGDNTAEPSNAETPPNHGTGPPATPSSHVGGGSYGFTFFTPSGRHTFQIPARHLPQLPGPEVYCTVAAVCQGVIDLCKQMCGHSDPHDLTADRVWFDFQAAGEFLITASADGSAVVQARQEPLGTSTVVTNITAVAVSVAGDRVAAYAGDAMSLTIDGQKETRSDFSARLPHGGVVERHGALLTIVWPGGSRLTVSGGGHLDFSFDPDPTMAPTLRGLLGSADGNPANDFTARDGTVLAQDDPAFAAKLYDPFGTSWRITQSESLFDYGPGQSTATFTKPEIPTGPATIDALDASTRSHAEALCRAMGVTLEPTLTNCILDVGITGDPSYAASAAAVQVSTATAAALPPDPSAGSSSGPKQTVSGTITKPSQVDRTTFTAKAGDVVYLDAQGTARPVCSGSSSVRPARASASTTSASGTWVASSSPRPARTRSRSTGTRPRPGRTPTRSSARPWSATWPISSARSSATRPPVSASGTATRSWPRLATRSLPTHRAPASTACSGRSWGRRAGSRLGPRARTWAPSCCLSPVSYAVEVYSDGTATGAYAFQVRAGP